MVIDFITEHKDCTAGGLRWGVEPMCTVLSEHGIAISVSRLRLRLRLAALIVAATHRTRRANPSTL